MCRTVSPSIGYLIHSFNFLNDTNEWLFALWNGFLLILECKIVPNWLQLSEGCVVLGADPSVNGRQSESITTTTLNSCHFVRCVSSPSSDKWFFVPNVRVNMFPWQWSFQGWEAMACNVPRKLFWKCIRGKKCNFHLKGRLSDPMFLYWGNFSWWCARSSDYPNNPSLIANSRFSHLALTVRYWSHAFAVPDG